MTFHRTMDARLVASVVAAGLMSFSGVMVETAMNVTFPTLMREFGVGTATVQWITTGYLLVLSLVIPASSYLKHRFPMRALFVVGACCFLAGTLAAALAPNFAVLLAGRLVQGVGTGVALPLMFNIILEQVPLQYMGLMVGIGNLVPAAAPAIGPSVGGLLVGTLGWRSVFWVLVPVVAAALIVGAVSIRQSSATGPARFDIPGFALLAVGFACFIFAASDASTAGWLSPTVLGLFAASLIALAVFVRWSLTRPAPLLRVAVFRSPVFALSVGAILFAQLICLGLGFLIPNHAQLTEGVDAFTAGCLLVPGCILCALLSPLSGRLLDRAGAAVPLLIGSAAFVASTVLFLVCAPVLGIWLTVAIYLVFSVGLGMSQATNMANGLAHLDAGEQADGNAVVTTVQQLAGAIGTAFVSSIVAAAQLARPDDVAAATATGTRNAFILLLVFALVEAGCVAAIVGIMRRRGESGRR